MDTARPNERRVFPSAWPVPERRETRVFRSHGAGGSSVRATRNGAPWKALCLAALVAGASGGCGKKTPLGEVQGTVRLDGQPLDNVAVTFFPDQVEGAALPRATATTDASGHYRLRCEDSREGAPVGWHRVTVEDLAPYRLPRDEDGPAAEALKLRVPGAYADPGKTPLRVQVQPGPQTIDLDLRWRASPGQG
jgi:hypothetical protein